jgi:hypothetical protein
MSIDYVLLGATEEDLQNNMVEGILARVLDYVKDRRPWDYQTHEIIQDRIDAREGARRAKRIQ